MLLKMLNGRYLTTYGLIILEMRILLVTEKMRVVGWVGPGWAMRGLGYSVRT